MVNFGEMKIDKDVPRNGVENGMKGDENKGSLREYSHIGTDEINTWGGSSDDFSGEVRDEQTVELEGLDKGRNKFNEIANRLRGQVELGANKLVQVWEWFTAWQDKNNSEKLKKGDLNKSRRNALKLGLVVAASMAVEVSGLKDVVAWIDKQLDEELSSSWENLSSGEREGVIGVIKKYDVTDIEIDGLTGEIVFIFSDGLDDNEMPMSSEDLKGKLEVLMREKIETTDYKMFEKIFTEQYLRSGRIDINLNVKREVQANWEEKYSKGGLQHKGLMESLDRMKPWYKEIKQVFENVAQKKGVSIPLELIYLAVPESHCKIRDKSSASAGGYYQLMRLISGDKGLVMKNGIDERFDILENARVAAEYLVDLYEEFETDQNTEEDTWRLVLARYNGVYSRSFKNYIKGSDYLKNYRNFLEFRELRLNDYLNNEVFAQGYFENYKVKKGESLESISNKYKLNLAELQRLNYPAKAFVAPGQKLKIPVFREKFEYKVRGGDSLWSIAKMYGVTRESIENHSDNVGRVGESHSIKEGATLTVEISDENGDKLRQSLETIFKVDLHSALENLNYPEKFYAILNVIKKEGLLFNDTDDTVVMEKIKGGEKSLVQISKEHDIALKSLKVVNPHILKSDIKIPDDVSVYISPKVIVKKHRRNKIKKTNIVE
jgi:LysM repeat protein